MVAGVSFIDGFDHYPDINTAGLGVLSTWYVGGGSSGGLSIVTGLNGVGRALRNAGDGGAGSFTCERNVTACEKFTHNFGFYVETKDANTADEFMAYHTAGLVHQCGLGIGVDRSLIFYNSAGTAVQTSAAIGKFFNTAVRYFIQVMVDMTTPGANTAVVKVNGTEWINISGVTLQSNTALTVAALGWIARNQASDFYVTRVDDMLFLHDWVLDTGELEVYTYGSDGEDTVQWSPLSSTNVSNIDEAQADGDTTYNYSNTPGQVDKYTYPNLPFVPEFIFAVSQLTAARKVSSATRTVRNVLEVDGNDHNGADFNLSTTYQYIFDHWLQNPETVADWEYGEVNDLISGYELVV